EDPYDINFVCPFPDALTSGHVTVIPFVPSQHAEKFTEELSAHPELRAYVPRTLAGLTAILTYTEQMRRRPERLFLAVLQGPKREMAGVVGYLGVSAENRVAEIGPVLTFPAYQGQGIASRAVALLLKLALDNPSNGGWGFRRIQYVCHPDNDASWHLAESLGFRREGIHRSSRTLSANDSGKRGAKQCPPERGPGGSVDGLMLAICWDDWENGVRDQIEAKLSRV
ncbi:acyl-CoA N-acyltransferase, partial [Fistulina hepatica ATCC 64428]